MSFWSFRPYVPVAKRREQAAREILKLKGQGHAVTPVVIEGRKIAHSFWGRAWCENLERYSDFANRLPRGRSYVRNGSLVDLNISRGKLSALVSGSEIYRVSIDIVVTTPPCWKEICKDCAGSVGSLVELLQGKLSKNVMERICREGDGLFPSPREIKMTCSCPDWADMCKHVAATLYGVGARLDAAPDLLFTLRGVDRTQLITTAGADLSTMKKQRANERILADDDLGALFGLSMEPSNALSPARSTPRGLRAQAKAEVSDRRSQPKKRLGDKKSVLASGGEAKKATAKDMARKASGEATVVASPQRRTEQGTNGKAATIRATEKSLASETGKAAVTRMARPPEPPSAKPEKAKTRWRDDAPAGRTRAARWIGLKARKANRK